MTRSGNYLNGIAAALLALAPAIALGQDKATLRVADYLPPNHLLYTHGLKPFMDDVQAMTGGRIAFQYFPGEQLGKAKDLLGLVQSGAVDMALIAPSYVSEKMPFTTITELPGLYTSACQGTDAFYSAASPTGVLGDEFKANKVRSVVTFMYQPADLLTAKKVVTTVEDWKGLKVRAAGGPTEVAVGEMGGTPIRMSPTDLYQALSRGTIDAAMLVATSAKVYSLDTVIKGITTGFSLGSIASAYILNQATWDRLPADVRAAFDKAGADASRKLCTALDEQEKQELDRMRTAGITITVLDQKQRDAWSAKADRLLTEWATRMKVPEERVRSVHTALKPRS